MPEEASSGLAPQSAASRLKKMYAELALENAAIKDVLSRKL